MKEKIIYISRSTNVDHVPENTMANSFIRYGFDVIRINCNQKSINEIRQIILNNMEAKFVFVYGRGCLPALTKVLKDINLLKIIWMPSIITNSQQVLYLVKNELPVFDIVYTAIPTEIPLYESVGIKAKSLFAAVDEIIYQNLNIEQDIDIGFYGRTHYPLRQTVLNYIDKKYKINCVYSIKDYINLINRTKININIGFFEFGIPNRVFDTLACNQFLISLPYKGVDAIFEDKKHLVYFNKENVYNIIDYYLKNEKERKEIALQGQTEVLKKHTFLNRINIIIKDIAELRLLR